MDNGMNWYFEDTVLHSLFRAGLQDQKLHHTLAFAVGRNHPDLRWRSRARKIASIHRASDGCQEECLCGGVSWRAIQTLVRAVMDSYHPGVGLLSPSFPFA